MEAKEAIELINQGVYDFSPEDLVDLSAKLTNAGAPGQDALRKLTTYVKQQLQSIADGKMGFEIDHIDAMKNVARLYGHGITDSRGRNIETVINDYAAENDIQPITVDDLLKNAAALDVLENKYTRKFEQDKEFDEVRKALDNIRLTENVNGAKKFSPFNKDKRLDLLKAAQMQAYTDCMVAGDASEAAYAEALKTNIEVAIYSMVMGDGLANDLQETGLDLEASAEKRIKEMALPKPDGKVATISGDAFMGYLATVVEKKEALANRIMQKFDKTKVGGLVSKLKSSIAAQDEKWSSKYGRPYKFARGVVMFAAPVGVGALAMGAAAFMGPAGLAAFGTYVGYNSIVPLIKSHKKERKNYKSFGQWLKNNKMNTLTAASGVLALGTAAWNVGNAVNAGQTLAQKAFTYASTTRAGVAFGSMFSKIGLDFYDAYKNGSKKDKWNAWKRLATTAAGFVANHYVMAGMVGSHESTNGHDGAAQDSIKTTGKVDGSLQFPAAADENAAGTTDQGANGNNTGAVASAGDGENGTSHGDGNDHNNPQKDPCEECKPKHNGRVIDDGNSADCDAKIAEQMRAPNNETAFWNNRNVHFLGEETTKQIYCLVDNGHINLDNFEGVDSKEEFAYKYAIMKANNIVDQRDLVAMIENAMDCGKLEKTDCEIIAKYMNSYDNHGHPLCWEATKVVESQNTPTHTVPEQQQEEQQPVHKPKEDVAPVNPEGNDGDDGQKTDDDREGQEIVADNGNSYVVYNGTIEEKVYWDPDGKLAAQDGEAQQRAGYEYNFKDAPTPESKDAGGYEYDTAGDAAGNTAAETAPYERVTAQGVIEKSNGGLVIYNFDNGRADIDFRQVPMDAANTEIAEHLEGLSKNPDKQAVVFAAYADVYHDLEERISVPDENGQVEKIPGAEQWMDAFDKTLAHRGLMMGEDGQIHIDPNANKEQLIAEMKEANGEHLTKEEKQAAKQAEKEAKAEAKAAAKAEKAAARGYSDDVYGRNKGGRS